MAERAAISYTLHAYDRMQERGVSRQEILAAIESGMVIEEYPEDLPFPSKLFLGVSASGPVHVVAAWDTRRSEWLVITVYYPELDRWEPDFRTRRR